MHFFIYLSLNFLLLLCTEVKNYELDSDDFDSGSFHYGLGHIVDMDEIKKYPMKRNFRLAASDIPESFDAREKFKYCKEMFNDIRNQGECGSCYAVSSTYAMSIRLCIQTKGKKKVHLSAQDGFTCCTAEKKCHGCHGGDAFQYWANGIKNGVVTGGEHGSNQGCIPYSDEAMKGDEKNLKCAKRCSNKNYKRSYDKDKYFAKKAYRVPTHNVTAMQEEILEKGVINVHITVYKDFNYYKKDVYRHVANDTKIGGHLVALIGWGVENNTKYWLGTNSWSKSFGLDGHFKFLRGEDHCQIESVVIVSGDMDLERSSTQKEAFACKSLIIIILISVLTFG